MNSGESTLPYQWYRAVIITALLSILVFSQFPWGILKLTYDSNDYMAASESLHAYLHGKNKDGHSYLVRAPLFPLYLSLFNDKVAATWWLNIGSFAASLLLLFRLGKLLDLDNVLLYGCLVTSALSYPWLQNHFFLWTEPVFCVFFFLLGCALLKNRSVYEIVGLCILLFLLRKAGLFVVAGAAGVYLINRDFKNFFVLSLTFSVVIIAWEMVGVHYAKTSPSINTFNYLRELSRVDFLDVLSAWWFPRIIPVTIRVMLVFGALTIVAIVLKDAGVDFIRKRNNQILLTLVIAYLFCVIVLIGSPEYMEAERYVSVVLPLVMLLLFSFCDTLRKAGHPRGKLFYGALALWTVYPVIRTISHFL